MFFRAPLWLSTGLSTVWKRTQGHYFQRAVIAEVCKRKGLTLDRLAAGTGSDGHLWESPEHDVVSLVKVEQGQWCEWRRNAARWRQIIDLDANCLHNTLHRRVIRRTKFLHENDVLYLTNHRWTTIRIYKKYIIWFKNCTWASAETFVVANFLYC